MKSDGHNGTKEQATACFRTKIDDKINRKQTKDTLAIEQINRKQTKDAMGIEIKVSFYWMPQEPACMNE